MTKGRKRKTPPRSREETTEAELLRMEHSAGVEGWGPDSAQQARQSSTDDVGKAVNDIVAGRVDIAQDDEAFVQGLCMADMADEADRHPDTPKMPQTIRNALRKKLLQAIHARIGDRKGREDHAWATFASTVFGARIAHSIRISEGPPVGTVVWRGHALVFTPMSKTLSENTEALLYATQEPGQKKH